MKSNAHPRILECLVVLASQPDKISDNELYGVFGASNIYNP